MPVEIEQWRAEIGNFNGDFHGEIMKLELNLLNIISSLIKVLARYLHYYFSTNSM